MFNTASLPSFTTVALIYIAYLVGKLIYRLASPLRSPLRTLPGPKSPSFIWGQLKGIYKSGPSEIHLKWAYEHGPTIAYQALFGRYRLMTMDPKALTYILNHSYDFPKPDEVRENVAELFGEGLLFAEGDAHKRQRRVMNPSFARPYIRELTEIFHEKSAQLRDILFVQIQNTKPGDTFVTNICPWSNKLALDVIGLAGFGYKFEALNVQGTQNELNTAFANVMKEAQSPSVFGILRVFVPILRKIPTRRTRRVAKSFQVMTRIGLDLIRSRKEVILHGQGRVDKEGTPNEIEKNSISGRDLLSRLLAANMVTDLPESHRLSDNDLFSQIPTFLTAGHETVAAAVAWTLFALSQDLSIQNKLREELLSVKTETPSMDELNSLPYFECVVRETMRLHSPVSGTTRVSAKDDLIPLEKPYKDKNGILRHEIPISKGDSIFIPILALNVHKDIWGDDALEFRPDRWAEQPEKIHDFPGIYANMLTFLAGPRACIGYRFALVELKCILFALLRSFQFELAVPVEEIMKRSVLVTRPVLKSAPKDGAQLPLKIIHWRPE